MKKVVLKRKHIRPRTTRKPLAQGDRIRLRWNPDWTGKIVHLGPEVSEVRFDTGGFRFIINEQLEAE